MALTGNHGPGQPGHIVDHNLIDNALAVKADLVGGVVPDAQLPAALARDAEVTALLATKADLTGGLVPASQLGSGTPSATTFLRGDRTFAAVSGLPSGVVGVASYDDLARSQLDSCDVATANFTGNSVTNILLDTVNKAEGVGAMRALMSLTTYNPASPRSFYWNAPSLVTVDRPFAAVTFGYRSDGPAVFGSDTTLPQLVELVVASGANLTGTVTVVTVDDDQLIDTFRTYRLPLAGLTTIGSVGIRQRGLTTSFNGRGRFYLDDIALPALTELDSALASAASLAVLVPPTYVASQPQGYIVPDPAKTVVDLRPGFAYITGLDGVRTIREHAIDTTGAADVTADLNRLFGSLNPEETVRFPADGRLLVRDVVRIKNKRDVVIDFNGARMFTDTRMTVDMIEVTGSKRCHIRRPFLVGFKESPRDGSTLSMRNSNLLPYSKQIMNTSSATSVPGWTAGANTTIGGNTAVGDRSGANENDGKRMRLTAVAAGDVSAVTTSTDRYQVRPSTSYTASAQFHTSATTVAKTAQVEIDWYDAANVFLSTSVVGTVTESVVETWATATGAVTSPATAAKADLRVKVVGATAAGEFHDVDEAVLKLTAPATLAVETTSALLSFQGDALIHAPDGTYGVPWCARNVDGYCTASWVISDTAQVAGDVELAAYDDVTGLQLGTLAVTATAVPTTYTLNVDTTDMLGAQIRWEVRKATAATNTIKVGSNTQFGKITYDGTYAFNAGINYTGSEDCMVIEAHVEGVGGDAIQSSSEANDGIYVYGLFSRGCMRQGASFNNGQGFKVFDFVIREAGRSGLDVEPSQPTQRVKRMHFARGEFINCFNYTIAMNNWAWVEDVLVEDITSRRSGLGFLIGGSRGGRWARIKHYDTYRVADDADFSLKAQDTFVEDVVTERGIFVSSERNSLTLNGTNVTVQAGSNTLRGIKITSPSRRPVSVRGTSTINDVQLGSSTFTVTPDFTATGAVMPLDLGPGVFAGIDTGPYADWFPQTVKGIAYDPRLWVPSGLDAHLSPVRNVLSLSADASRGPNLRGRAVAVSTGATSATVTFPTRGPALTLTTVTGTPAGATTTLGQAITTTPSAGTTESLAMGSGQSNFPDVTPTGPSFYVLVDSEVLEVTDTTLSTWTVKRGALGSVVATHASGAAVALRGTLAPSTTYYYRVGRWFDRVGGPQAYNAEISRVTTSTQTAAEVRLSNIATVGSGFVEAVTVLRGTTSGGPYTTRYDVLPVREVASFNTNYTQLIDLGDRLNPYEINNALFGYAPIVLAQTGSFTVVDESGYEPDAAFVVVPVPNWITTVAVTAKRRDGFDLSFGIAAPANATVDWMLVR